MNKSELKPLEVNGITAVTIGTILWSLSLVGLLASRSWLTQEGRTDWIWIALSGVCLGILGYRYTTNRVKRMQSKFDDEQSSLIHDFE